MALTYSSMLDLGTEIVPFKLLNVLTNENFSSNNLDHNKSSLIMFICNHCPYVIHYHEQIKILASEYTQVQERTMRLLSFGAGIKEFGITMETWRYYRMRMD